MLKLISNHVKFIVQKWYPVFFQNQEILHRYNVQPGSSVLLLNGMLIDLESADPLSLLKKLRAEASTVGGLSSLGIPFADINKLLKSDLYKQGAKYGIDMRDDGMFSSKIAILKLYS